MLRIQCCAGWLARPLRADSAAGQRGRTARHVWAPALRVRAALKGGERWVGQARSECGLKCAQASYAVVIFVYAEIFDAQHKPARQNPVSA